MRFAAAAWRAYRRLPTAIILVTLGAWLLLVSAGGVPGLAEMCLADEGVVSRGILVRVSAVWLVVDLPTLGMAIAMLVAMMAPLLASPLSHVYHSSLEQRRSRSTALFLLGYLSMWAVAGLLLIVVAAFLDSLTRLIGVPAVGASTMLAVAWQATPWKQHSLNGCHRRSPLSAFGRKADLDAVAFGLRHGRWCVGTCWALMIIPFGLAGFWHWAVMLALLTLLLVERSRAPLAPHWWVALTNAAGPRQRVGDSFLVAPSRVIRQAR